MSVYGRAESVGHVWYVVILDTVVLDEVVFLLVEEALIVVAAVEVGGLDADGGSTVAVLTVLPSGITMSVAGMQKSVGSVATCRPSQ